MYHTNTWGGRHSEQLAYLVEATAQKVALDKDEPLRILQIGAGGVPVELMDLYSTQPSRSAIARVKNSTQRKFYSGNFHTFESVELVNHYRNHPDLKDTKIELTVMDISSKVLDAVPRSFVVAGFEPYKLNLVHADVQGPMPASMKKASQHVAWAGVLFPHLKNRQAAYENITELIAAGGLFSLTRAEKFSVIKWALRGLVGRLNEDFTHEIDRQNRQEIEREIANPQSSYADVVDLAGRRDYDIITGKFPLYQRK